MTATLVLTVDVDAPVEQTWAGATDWENQGEWILGTKVWPATPGATRVGTTVKAFTGVGPVGFLDTMHVTLWDPPHRCHVLHTGWLVKGPGEFEVEPRGDGASRFVWRERLDLPLGVLGRLGWPLVKPFFALSLQLSLKRFARWVESGAATRRAA